MRGVQVILLILCILVLTPAIYGYVDPGTGSFLLQIAIAAFVGAAFTVKMFWQKIVNFFKKDKDDDENP